MSSVLFTTESLFDTNIGLARLLYKEYGNPVIVKETYKDAADSFFQHYLMEEALEPNILKLLFKDPNMTDDYYQLFIKEKWLDIVKLSIRTSMSDLVKTYKISKGSTGINSVILCRSDDEAKYISSKFKDIDIVVCPIEELKDFDIGVYTKLIVGDIRFLTNFNLGRIRGKNILALGYRYNFDTDNSKKLLSNISFISDINQFEVALPYIDYEPAEG